MGAAQKVALEQTPRALAVAAFLHNVVMGANEFCFGGRTVIAPITPHYVKKLGRKNWRRKSWNVRVFVVRGG